MARGYSASRSNSKRPTLRLKRERSASMTNVQRGVAVAQAKAAAETAEKNKHADVMKMKNQQEMKGAPKSTSRSASRRKKTKSQSAAPPAAKKRTPSALRVQLKEREEEMPSDFDVSEDEHETVEKPDVMTKYKAVGRIVDEVLDILAAACIAGTNTKTLCDTGDLEITSRLKSLFSKAKDENGKRIQKGICYPTNVSINEVLCNHSPFREDEALTLRPLQVVKLHCGCHLDGYPVMAARTIVVPSSAAASSSPSPSPATPSSGGSRTSAGTLSKSGSNAIEAARVSLGGMIKMLRPGTSNADITDFIATVGAAFGAEAVEGVLSNRVKRWVLDGVDCIINRRVVDTVPQQDVDECQITPYQVWALDVAFTNSLGLDLAAAEEEAEANGGNAQNEEEAATTTRTGTSARRTVDDQRSYRTTPTEEAVTIFRRTPMDFPNDARVQQANEVLKELTDKFGCFPFHLRGLSNPLRGKLGILTLLKHQVVDKMPALRVKNALSGRRVTARFAATVAVTGKRITILCGAPPEQPVVAGVAGVDAALQPAPLLGLLPDMVVDTLNQSMEFATSAALRAAAAGEQGTKKKKNEEPQVKRSRKERQ